MRLSDRLRLHGGHHRSVTFAEYFRARLLKEGYRVVVSHRDIAREH